MNRSIAALIADVFGSLGATTCRVLVLCLLCVSLEAAGQTAGKVTFVNACKFNLTFFSSGPAIGTLPPGGRKSIAISAFRPGGANVVIPYPDLSNQQCPNCDGWTALGGVPGTEQRAGWMWMKGNTQYAAYCNPNLSGRAICALQKNCCGTQMVQDGTFGTHWEFTPKGTATDDFANLSTNFGSGPTSPPSLCGQPGVNPNDCVAKAANIFFNVPIAWTTNLNCSFTTKSTKVKGLKCLSVDCPDAYKHPTDDKQAACSTDPTRWYVVTYCPAGSSMPKR